MLKLKLKLKYCVTTTYGFLSEFINTRIYFVSCKIFMYHVKAVVLLYIVTKFCSHLAIDLTQTSKKDGESRHQ